MSSVLANLGNLHIVTGQITVTSGTWALTSNDGSVTLTDNGAGDVSVNFVHAFLSAPIVVASMLKAAPEATVFHGVTVEAVTTALATFQWHHDTAATNSLADPDDGDGCHFIAIGVRNN